MAEPVTAAEAPERPPDDVPRASSPRQRLARTAVLFAAFVCAACGLVYELALVALGSYLIGDTIGQASLVLSIMVFAMGVGALAAKPFQRWAEAAFAGVEIALALLGGLSVLLLYGAFAWLSLYTPVLIVIAVLLGLLIGAEIPLLMVLLQRIRRQDAGSAVADISAADYIGALLGGLSFPFLLLPVFGQIRGALLVGALNAVVGLGLVLTVFRGRLGRVARYGLAVAAVAVTGVLTLTFVLAGRYEYAARQALYADPVIHAEHTPYQEIVITESMPLSEVSDTRLYLNGDLQFSSADEYRYHEALVHPAMADRPRSVLILGGGDGLALREVLRYDTVERVRLVELDPAVISLARSDAWLTGLNDDALADDRVRVATADAFQWLRDNAERFDTIIVDMPDPDSTATAKLYSVEFYTLLRHALAPGGTVAVQSGSPYFAPKSYWSIAASMAEAGWRSRPYHVSVPSFGDWGFHLAALDRRPRLRLADGLQLRSLDTATLRAAGVFPVDRRQVDVLPSTLMRPRILEYAGEEWVTY